MAKNYRPCKLCGTEIEIRGSRMYCYSCSDEMMQRHKRRRLEEKHAASEAKAEARKAETENAVDPAADNSLRVNRQRSTGGREQLANNKRPVVTRHRVQG